VISVGL